MPPDSEVQPLPDAYTGVPMMPFASVPPNVSAPLYRSLSRSLPLPGEPKEFQLLFQMCRMLLRLTVLVIGSVDPEAEIPPPAPSENCMPEAVACSVVLWNR